MLKFYDIDAAYADYLRKFDKRIPNISYSNNNKFVCGVVLSIDGNDYFAPLSSQKAKQQTNMLITDETGTILSSIKFSFMFPAPKSVIKEKDFSAVRATDPAYADLLDKEYTFCKKNEKAIQEKAKKVYEIGCKPSHALYVHCCDFKMLENKKQEWIEQHSEPQENQEEVVAAVAT